MSQQNNRNRSRGSGGSNRQASGPSRKVGTPPPVRQPLASSQRQSRVEQTLPPFSTRRYMAIWLLGLIPLVVIILLLARPWERSAASVPTAAPAANVATAGGDKYMIIETAKGRIVAKLRTEAAAGVSKTIANFEQKANAGQFNGRTFHRVEGWVIQGGDPLGNGAGGGEMPSEYNQINFAAGSLGVARGGDPAINNDSQFFIVKTDSPHLNGLYTNWGAVIEGMDVVNKIAIGDKMTKVTISNQK